LAKNGFGNSCRTGFIRLRFAAAAAGRVRYHAAWPPRA
jgi:hypothetical protein